MFFSSPPMWKMVKGSPNHVSMKMIGLAQTSQDTQGHLCTNISGGSKYSGFPTVQLWSYQYTVIHLLCGGSYNLYMTVRLVPVCDRGDKVILQIHKHFLDI